MWRSYFTEQKWLLWSWGGFAFIILSLLAQTYFDVIINATSVGLKRDQTLNLDFSKIEKGKFFYDVIYNPKETNFLKAGKQLGNQTENGKKMFIYQAAEAFKIWHKVEPEINEEINKLLDK